VIHACLQELHHPPDSRNEVGECKPNKLQHACITEQQSSRGQCTAIDYCTTWKTQFKKKLDWRTPCYKDYKVNFAQLYTCDRLPRPTSADADIGGLLLSEHVLLALRLWCFPCYYQVQTFVNLYEPWWPTRRLVVDHVTRKMDQNGSKSCAALRPPNTECNALRHLSCENRVGSIKSSVLTSVMHSLHWTKRSLWAFCSIQ